ncbi:LPS export ABC transporter periplasmic protein LptC [Nitratireductor basaltis]|uniref:LPS export ABC transporter periplasmic protein LptC n=1 Tax=Nitratireductor basaltis TaxID=472175 RepID=A0A084UEL5_9HYPH|nr:LPS export ABC transporter periplasmic protein LptC [Nitratireductor basaltis]KFB11401.1 hypothetical protein EL18_02449 [Nitratireductor basaltis]
MTAGHARTEHMRSDAIRRAERGERDFARAQAHSRRVRAMKWFLPAVASGCILLFVGYSMLSSVTGGDIDLGSATIKDGKLVMANPTLEGFTRNNLPYTMTAARARQEIGSETAAIDLEEITATVPFDDGDQAVITASEGRFDRSGNALTLNQTIELETTNGISARLESADVDVAKGSLKSDKPVEINMDGLSIRADRFSADDGGKVLVFEDRVRVIVDPQKVRRGGE